MALTRQERERLIDNRLKIQSVANSLTHIDPTKIQDFHAIQHCLQEADECFAGALRSSGTPTERQK
jgi:hypothetical protein